MTLPRPDMDAAREGYVFVYDIAMYLHIKPDTLAKRVENLGIPTTKFINEERGRWGLAVKSEDAKSIIEAERNKPRIVKPEELFK